MLNMIRRALAAVEPFYDRGSINTWNMSARTETEVVEGEVRYFEAQWLGIQFAVQLGRTLVAAKRNR